MRNDLIFLIEGGKAMELFLSQADAVTRANNEVSALAEELGVRYVFRDHMTGRLNGVQFEGEHHPQFTKPKRNGESYPKKNTEWDAKFKAQTGHPFQSSLISKAFNVPLAISYETPSGSGSTCIGTPFNECGFMSIGSGDNLKAAMWIPDVALFAREKEDQGCTVTNKEVKLFKPEFDGCRQIGVEEWELIVAQFKVDEKLKSRTASPDEDAPKSNRPKM